MPFMITPSESVILHGSDFAPKIPVYKVLLQKGAIGFVFMAGSVAFFYGSSQTGIDQPVYLFGFILLGIMFCLVGLYIGLSNSSIDPDYELLLDKKTWVNNVPLAFAFIRAAVLANIEAGFIQAKTAPNGELVLVATGKLPDWPSATLEGRLDFDEEQPLSNILKEWLGTLSKAPEDRVVTLAKIMLVIRGIATMVTDGVIGNIDYLYSDQFSKSDPGATKMDTGALFEKYRSSQPELFESLNTSISKAMTDTLFVSSGPNDSFSEPDPWDAELDAKKYLPSGHQGMIMISMVGTVFTGAMLGLYSLQITHPWVHWAVLVSLVITLWQGLLYLPLPFFKKIRGKWRTNPINEAEWDWSGKKQTKGFILKYLFHLVVVFVVMSYLLSAPYLLYLEKPLFGYASGALALVIIYYILGKRIAKKISDKVASSPEQPVIVKTVMDAGHTEIPLKQGYGTPPVAELPFKLQQYMAHDLPLAPAEVQKQFQDLMAKGRSMNRVYKISIGILMGVTVLILWLFYLLRDTNINQDTLEFFAVFESVLGVITLVYFFSKYSSQNLGFLIGAIFGMSNAKGVDYQGKGSDIDLDERSSVRCRRLFAIGVLWIILILLNIRFVYTSSHSPHVWLGSSMVVLSLLSISGYLISLQRLKRKMESRYPYPVPYNLLALRVFGTPHLGNFLELISNWKYFGTLLRLDGPDTVGFKVSDFVHYFEGKLDDSIVKNEQELNRALASFSYQANASLRFATNSMQCTNATWKQAIQALYEKADLIVMDMSALSEKNQGIAYELGKTIQEFPLTRVIILIDDTTDKTVLNNLLTKICQDISEGSPNYQTGVLTIKLLDTGGMSSRDENETAYDWRKRLHKRLNENQLVSLVITVANPRKNLLPSNQNPDNSHNHWADPFPSLHPGRWTAVSLSALLLLIIWILMRH